MLHYNFLSIPFIFLSFFPSRHCKIEVLVYFKSRSTYSFHKRFSKFNFREPWSAILAGEQELNWILQTHFTYIYEHGVALRQPSVFTLNWKSVSFLFFIPILNRIKFQEWLFSIDKFCPYQLIEFETNASMRSGRSILEGESFIVDKKDKMIGRIAYSSCVAADSQHFYIVEDLFSNEIAHQYRNLLVFLGA